MDCKLYSGAEISFFIGFSCVTTTKHKKMNHIPDFALLPVSNELPRGRAASQQLRLTNHISLFISHSQSNNLVSNHDRQLQLLDGRKRIYLKDEDRSHGQKSAFVRTLFPTTHSSEGAISSWDCLKNCATHVCRQLCC